MTRALPSIFLIALALAGCARNSARQEAHPPIAATQPLDPKAEMTLDQIEPDARNVAFTPTTAPATQPTLEALDAYARGRGALADKQVYTAVNMLEKAAGLDPASAQVQYLLGRAYLAAGKLPQAQAAMEKATQIAPDWLEAQVDLARLYLRTEPAKALRSLIIAANTREYASNDADASIVDFYLARLLQQSGYDRAAVEQYEKLLWRLARKSLSIRGNADLATLANRSEPLQLELAKLYEKRGQSARAIAMYQKIAEQAPDAVEPQSRLIRAQILSGDVEVALRRARDLVVRWNASAASIELLRDAYRAAGNEPGALAELRRLHDADPGDRAVLMALADTLAAEGRNDEAEQLIADAAGKVSGNFDLVRKLVNLYSGRDQTAKAAQLLIQTTANHPQMANELWVVWQPLLRAWRVNALGPDEVREIAVAPDAQAAKDYWIAVIAQGTDRPTPQRTAARQYMARVHMTKSTAADPPFEPAFRGRVRQIWTNAADEPPEEKERQTAALVVRARQAGNEKLALQMEAIAATHSMKSPQDLPFFEKAVSAGEAAPDFLLDYGQALSRASQNQKFEQWMWKLVSDYPFCGDGYALLLLHYEKSKSTGPKMKVVNTWMSADPQSPGARLSQAAVFLSIRQFDAVEALMLDLIRDDPRNESLLRELKRYYLMTEQAQKAADFLSKQIEQDPANGAAIEVITELYLEQGQTPSALRELESAEKNAPAAANLLYHIAGLYYATGEKPAAERVMERALAIDPRHVASSNDLAYYWAEAGKNLTESERLARQAVAAEPDNSAYLDTLGWALYKQGRFDEARQYLDQAVLTASPVDPVLLDHLGDALYRLGDVESAARNWRAAADLLGRVQANREDHDRLRLELQNKLRQRSQNQPVEVSPVAEARN